MAKSFRNGISISVNNVIWASRNFCKPKNPNMEIMKFNFCFPFTDCHWTINCPYSLHKAPQECIFNVHETYCDIQFAAMHELNLQVFDLSLVIIICLNNIYFCEECNCAVGVNDVQN